MNIMCSCLSLTQENYEDELKLKIELARQNIHKNSIS